MKKNWLKMELEIKIFDCCYTCTVPIRPNLTIEQTLTKPQLYFWGLLGVYFLKYCIHLMFDLGPLKVFFGFTQGLQWVYSGCAFALNTDVWSRPIFYLTYNLTACNFHSFYIPNTHARSAFRDLHFWLGFTLDLCIHSGLTLGLLLVLL